ncbi:50S ribosomal protein L23 [Candidatus Collierbacteria bacterium]|nr:50S ribosomal protein L23 [Candidatus Collierbacteria bacterium]
MKTWEIIKKPIVTEKALAKGGNTHRFTFEVDRNSAKTQIKEAIFAQFGIRPKRVNTSVRKGRSKRTRGGRAERMIAPKKYAVVFFSADQKIPETLSGRTEK